MSFQAMAWAVEQDVGDPLAKFLLLMIANYANEDWIAWPSMRRLEADTGMSKRTVINKLSVLEERRFIGKTQRRTTSGDWAHNVYQLLVDESQTAGVVNDDYQVVHDVHGGSERGTLRGGVAGAPPSEGDAHEPIIKPVSPPGGGTHKKFARPLPDDWQPTAELMAWARADSPNVDALYETDKFRDHWSSTGESKADWSATWRNWIRRSRRDYEPRARANGSRSRADRPADHRDPERLARENNRRANEALSLLRGEETHLFKDE